MITIACVLKSGPEYRVEHVIALRAGVRRHLKMEHRFLCISDQEMELRQHGVQTVGIPEGWSGWWAKICLFRPALFLGPVVYLDLDTIVVGRLDDIVLGHRFTVLRNFWRDHRIGSGVMAWDNREVDLSVIYSRFASAPGHWMREYRTPEKWGDQQFIFDNTPIQPERWQIKHPGRVLSYKRDILRKHHGKVPGNASIIAYHGRPRPWETSLWDRRCEVAAERV